MHKELLLVGDKVLIEPLENTGKTDAGLYLPHNVREKEKIQEGRVIKVGPGYPVPDPSLLDQEPWTQDRKNKYFPLQTKSGDCCLYLKDQGIEIEFEKKNTLLCLKPQYFCS